VCSVNDPPLSGGWVKTAQGAANYPYGTCVDGCKYSSASLPGTFNQTYIDVDGYTWWSVQAWTPTGTTCTALPQDNAPPPPPDADSDGASDGNDSAPNNPGQKGGGGGEDPGGVDKNGDGDEGDEGDDDDDDSGGGGAFGIVSLLALAAGAGLRRRLR
jgi:MYXO-CTERM domain-containing protein